MSTIFDIEKNEYLKIDTTGFYHQIYTGFGQAGNPDFLNTLKNTFKTESIEKLHKAEKQVEDILVADLPTIIKSKEFDNFMLVSVPRAKDFSAYSPEQLLFSSAVKKASERINGIDGTDCIKRVVSTRTTHLRKPTSLTNDGKMPYPGITRETCEISETKVRNQNIILVDDIYTKRVNIDEDCIQALLDEGAKNVVFYSIGYTLRTQ